MNLGMERIDVGNLREKQWRLTSGSRGNGSKDVSSMLVGRWSNFLCLDSVLLWLPGLVAVYSCRGVEWERKSHI